MTRTHIPIVDVRQKFWQLAFIQSAAMGLPVILIGGYLASQYGSLLAMLALFAGNMILWLIGLVMILMTPRHENAVENVSNYLGKGSKYVAAIVLTIAFLGWFSLQTKSISTLAQCKLGLTYGQELKIGSALGLITALLAMGGIRLIKWFTCISFPILLFILLFITFKYRAPPIEINQLAFSFSSIIAVVASILTGIINIPTFFRHSQSRAHSIGGLSLIIVINYFVQSLSILWRVGSLQEFCALPVNLEILFVLGVLLLISVNLVNIYFAAAAWEAVSGKGAGPKGYAIFGLIGTLFYCALQASSPMQFLESLVNSFIGSLGIVLLISFLISILVSHRHRHQKYEKFISNLAWFLGCLASLFALIKNPSRINEAFIWGLSASLFSFFIIIFIEETTWALKKLMTKKRSK